MCSVETKTARAMERWRYQEAGMADLELVSGPQNYSDEPPRLVESRAGS